jgi:hypothetical protein
LQFTETTDGRKYFKEYWIREWDGKDYNLSEHIKNIDEAIKCALELDYEKDANKLKQIKQGDLSFEPA